MKIPIGLQLYSVRNQCADDLMGVLESVAKMGYEGVEFAGYHGHEPNAIRKKLDEVKLQCPSTHTGFDQLSDDKFDETVDLHHVLGAKTVVVPWLAEELRATPEACKKTAQKLTKLTERLQEKGLRLGFHAHHADMHPLDGGESAWYILAKHTPKDFVMQYDTANGMAGGADPVQPILDLPGRGQLVHLKEWNGEHGTAMIGEGDVPWQRVFDAAEKFAGVEWYIVEHENDHSASPMDDVDRCLQNLRRMGK